MTLRVLLVVPAFVIALAVGGASVILLQEGMTASALPQLLALLTIVLLAAGLILTVNRATTRWVHAATSFAGQLTAGRFHARVPGTNITELAVLSDRMNEMASAIQETTEKLRRQAFHDPLTGLPNRAHFMQRAREALGGGAARGSVAVLFIDLDRFKMLNDTLGHAAGDSLLQVVADRLQAVTGSAGLVARLGGDEFTVLVHSSRAEEQAIVVAQRIVANLRRPYHISGHQMFVTASVGISCNEAGEEGVTELMRKADVALYRAKANGKSRFALFNASLDAISVEQLHMDTDLRSAVSRNQLTLKYQPEFDLRTGRLLGMEALLRWNHPRRGVLSPAEFIALAEETGEILRMGSWAIENACHEVMALPPDLPGADNLILAVNLSASEFKEPSLVADIAQVLDRSGLQAGRLKIELTESVLLEDIQTACMTIDELRRIGVGVAIDDFGTGYSSLSYLQILPVDTLKIDQSFVKRVGVSSRSDAILSAVIDLGSALDLHIVAEGIETREQFEFLRSARCPAGQGFLFSPPLSTQEFVDFARRLAPGEPLPRMRLAQRKAS